MNRKIISFFLIITFLLTFVTPIYALEKKDGKIIMTEEEFLKLANEIKHLKDINETLQKENDLLKKKISLLDTKIQLLEEQLNAKEKYINEITTIYSEKESNLQKQLEALTKKVQLEIDIVNEKEAIISIKEEQIREQKKKTILYSTLALIVGAAIDRFVFQK